MIPRGLTPSALLVAAAVCVPCGPRSAAAQEEVPRPRDVLGFTPGDDYRLADFPALRAYFEALAAASPRVRLSSAGTTPGGNAMLVAVISSEANLANLDRHREISHTLARGRLPDEEARALAREGRAVVWIDAGLHSAEMAHAQHAMPLAHRVATEETDEMRHIRENVILVLLPCVNPDGLDLVADWYRRTVHTPHQDSPMPWLFHPYAGWDNNRDFFMQTQTETRILSRLLYNEWLPQIAYNHHQGFYPTRIFVPPFPDPFNPNIDPEVLRGIELVGAVMQHRFEREGKDGVISRYGFSSWYNGSARTTLYFHNIIGILTETTHDSPSPFYYDPADFPERFGNGWSTREPSTNYPRPWRGGWLRFQNAIDYMITGSLGALEAAARFREELLHGMHRMARRQIALGAAEPPVAYVVPPDQHDPPTAAHFLEILMRGGVEVHRAAAPFTADGESYPAGSHVILLSQPFRPFAKDLLEPQRYPDIRRYPGGPPVPPYDNAGWTLSYQMGVRAVPVERPFEADLVRLDSFPAAAGSVAGDAGFGFAIDPRTTSAFVAVNRLLREDYAVGRTRDALDAGGQTLPPGAFVVPATSGLEARLRDLARELGLAVRGLSRRPPGALADVRPARVGVYRSWVVEWVDGWTAGEGWTRFLLDGHEFPYQTLANADIRSADLAARFDVIVIPDQDAGDIVGGYRLGRRQFGVVHQNLPPPEYHGGIEADGVAALRAFVEAGGTLVLVDRAADLAGAEYLDLPVRNVLAGLDETEFFGPGSVVRLATDAAHPLGYGMAENGAAYFRKGRAFETDAPGATVVARYGERDVLLSGWLLGEEHMAGRAAALELPAGRGSVVLFGFPPYFRAWPHATFKLFLNALYLAGPAEERAEGQSP